MKLAFNNEKLSFQINIALNTKDEENHFFAVTNTMEFTNLILKMIFHQNAQFICSKSLFISNKL